MKNTIAILLCILCLFMITGCNNNEEGENEVSKTELALKEDGYTLFEGKIDSKQFKDISYTIPNAFSKTTLVINNDGSMFKYNLQKVFSNNSHIINYNSKFSGDVLLGLLGSSDVDDTYWLFDSEKKLYKFDATTDKLTLESDLDNYVVFRGTELDDALRKVSFDKIFKRSNYNIYLLKENKLYNFNYLGIYEENADSYVEDNEYNLNIDLTDEKIEYMDNDFLKTNKNYYLYRYVESKYADQKSDYQYVKLNVSKYKDDIEYISDSIAVLKNGIIYNR